MTRIGLLVLLLLGLTAPAQAFTSLPAGGETALIAPKTQTPPADRQGDWQLQPGSAQLAAVHPSHEHFLLLSQPAGTLGDGFVRLRMTLTRAGKAGLVLRASAPAGDPAGLTGYGVLIGKASAEFVRWDHGKMRPLDRPQALPGLEKAETVELNVWLIGPHIAVQVLDGKSLEVLGALSLSDRALTEGRLGLYALARKPPGPVFELWTVRRAASAGQVQPGPNPAGVHRFVAMPDGALETAEPEVRTAWTLVDRQQGTGIYRGSPRALEQLLRAGIEAKLLEMDTPFRYLDEDYRAQVGKPPEATPSGFRTDLSYKNPAMLEALLRGYAKRFPQLASVVELGRSVQGRPILALHLGARHEDGPRPSVLLSGGHHGDELLSVEFALDAVQGLLELAGTNQEVDAWLDALDIWCVPMVNPDGVQAFLELSSFSGRKNGRDTSGDGRYEAGDGVDLNRNYPFRWHSLGEVGSRSQPRDEWYRGPAPASEPETQAMMQLAEREHFVASISYHTWDTVVLAPYTTDGVANPEPNEAWHLAELVARAAPMQPNHRRFVVKRQIYPVDGVDQDWLRAAFGTAALLIEGAYHNPVGKLRRETVAATRPTWQALLRAVAQGPRISGTVRDAAGQPVAAEVTVAQQAPRAGEHWLARARDGHFDRLLVKPGVYTLRVAVPGHDATLQQVEVSPGHRAEVAVVLPYSAAVSPRPAQP